MDLEKQNLADELQQTQAELEKVQSANSTHDLPDLKEIRDRVLAELKLGKQATGYKAAQKALDKFIEELRNVT